jgi:hypothetical protein
VVTEVARAVLVLSRLRAVGISSPLLRVTSHNRFRPFARREAEMLPVVLAVLGLAAPVPKVRPNEPVQIDLASAYSTVKMGRLKLASSDPDEVLRECLSDVHYAVGRAGLSCAFLVAGDDFGDAVRATARVFGGGLRADEVVRNDPKKGEDIWVCAFLGNSSTTPPAFAVRRIEVDGLVVRVVFSKPRSLLRSCDFSPFVVWANLGKLPPGKYRVELVDGDRDDEVVVARKVTVTRTKK